MGKLANILYENAIVMSNITSILTLGQLARQSLEVCACVYCVLYGVSYLTPLVHHFSTHL